MSKYTVELREIVESGVNIFNFDYPFYDATKKKEFEKAFIDHFYLREIGAESPGRFIHYLKRTFNEKLPLYNELFKTAMIEYNKLGSDYEETYTKGNKGESDFTGTNKASGTSTTDDEHKHLDTPQGKTTAIDNYLTDLTKDKNTNNSSSTGESNTKSTVDATETMTKKVKGATGSTSARNLLDHIKVQETLSKIKEQFFEECNDLFMMIY